MEESGISDVAADADVESELDCKQYEKRFP
jgi:hypothetical protein